MCVRYTKSTCVKLKKKKNSTNELWKQQTMKQRKFIGINSSCLNECNGHVNHVKRTNAHECRRTNGNHIRHKIPIKSDKPNHSTACATYQEQEHEQQKSTQQMLHRHNRSQRIWCWCRQFTSDSSKATVQTSLPTRPTYYSKFAFHEIMRAIVIVFVLITVHCVANGQRIESQWNAKTTGEWVILLCITTNIAVDADLDPSTNERVIRFYRLRPSQCRPHKSSRAHVCVCVCCGNRQIKWLHTEFVEVLFVVFSITGARVQESQFPISI